MLKIYSFYTILLLLLTGCHIMDDTYTKPSVSDNGFVLNLALDTRTGDDAESTEDENNIQSVFVFFFEYTADQSGKLLNIYNDSLKGRELTSLPVFLNSPTYQNIEASGEYNLLITTNAEYYTRAQSYTGSMQDMDELRKYFLQLWGDRSEKEIAQGAFLRLDNENIKPDCLPMSGKAVKRAGSDEVNVVLTRCVSRLEVVNTDKNYKLVSAAVWNALARTTVWDKNPTKHPDDEYIPLPTVKADPESNRINTGLYAFENYVGSPEQNDDITTCLIIGLERTDNGQLAYFRLNMHPPKRMQQLKRNNIYRFTIRKVLGDGEENHTLAYEQGTSLLDGNLNGWIDESLGGITSDENNILALSFANLYFPPEGGKAMVEIFTQGPGDLQKKDFLPDGITANLDGKKLVIEAKGSPEEREGKIEVKLGKLELSVGIQQGGATQDDIILSRDTIGVFPAKIDKTLAARPVKITATGPWTARIYNNPHHMTGPPRYTFNEDRKDGSVVVYNSKLPEDFLPIYIHDHNHSNKATHSFIMISLNDNPGISRILLLTQHRGGLSVSDNSVEFRSDGYSLDNPSDKYVDIQVDTEFDEWWFWLWHGDKGNFYWEKRKVNDTDEKETILRISTKPDKKGQDRKITLRVYVEEAEGLFQDIVIHQAPHILKLKPNIENFILGPDGGYSQPITITSTSPWIATIKGIHTTPGLFLNDETGSLEKDKVAGKSGDSIRIYFPPLSNNQDKATATVTITMPGTDIKKEIFIEQTVSDGTDSWGIIPYK